MWSTRSSWCVSLGLVPAFSLILLSAAPAAAGLNDCGQPVSSGGGPTATDSLFTLRAAIGLAACEVSVCDVDSTCSVTATDALLVLGVSIGGQANLVCDGGCFATSTTSTSSTTSTTMAPPAWADVMTVFGINGCAVSGCHGGNGNAGDLRGLDSSSTGYNELLSDPVDCFSSSYQNRVVPGNPGASFLLAKLEGLADCGGSMPPFGGPLFPEDIEIIRQWIAAGAPQN